MAASNSLPPPTLWTLATFIEQSSTITTLILDDLHYNWPVLGSIWLVLFIAYAAEGLRRIFKGLVSLTDLIACLDTAFSKKLVQQLTTIAQQDPNSDAGATARRHIAEIEREGARFRHLELIGIRLRVVAADIHKAKLETFSRTETPDVRISDAIGASIAIPIIFKKHSIEGRSVYHDGGIVSALPGWAFENMHALSPDSWVIAVSLIDPALEPPLPRWRRFVRGALSYTWSPIRHRIERYFEPFTEIEQSVKAAINGRTTIDLRPKSRVAHIRIQTTVGPLDFDAYNQQAKVRRARMASKSAAKLLLGEILCNEPHRQLRLSTRIVTAVEKLLEGGIMPPDSVMRIQIARPHPNKTFLNVIFARKFSRNIHGSLIDDRVPDERMVLPTDRTDIGKAFDKGTPLFPIGLRKSDHELQSSEDYYRRALKAAIPEGERPEWRWVIPVHEHHMRSDETQAGSPMIKEGRPYTLGKGRSARLVLCIECNLDPDEFGLDGDMRYYYECIFSAMAYEHLVRNSEDREKVNDRLINQLIATERGDRVRSRVGRRRHKSKAH